MIAKAYVDITEEISVLVKQLYYIGLVVMLK